MREELEIRSKEGRALKIFSNRSKGQRISYISWTLSTMAARTEVYTQTLSSSLALPGSHGSAVTTSADSKPKKKICCACPDTKRIRDECMVEKGEAACTKWINAHIECLRAEGFNV
ncbi:hypothetical protein NE237_004433 [Protea cynaroides]|uniref:Cytochrome c oxidase copper chaperone n=1 Tax=Protea cynaroides TaxID=273540 RepID=A0A9Q0KJF6_9MAGN|nr:hypothetical protein NE237_004433 [Protea cynaroides]